MVKTKCCRIHTENKNADWIKELLNSAREVGATLHYTEGLWEGTIEKSLEILVYTDNTELIRAFAERIKHNNEQKAVLYSETDCYIELI